jgi:Ca2+-dependent lipid-binding protein
LKPDPFHRKYKTSVKWKNLNPVFNEEFLFDTKMTELPKQALEIAVWDKDYGKSNDYLGEYLIFVTFSGQLLFVVKLATQKWTENILHFEKQKAAYTHDSTRKKKLNSGFGLSVIYL